MQGRFRFGEACQIINASASQLKYWITIGLVKLITQAAPHVRFDYRNLLVAYMIAQLRSRGLPLQQMHVLAREVAGILALVPNCRLHGQLSIYASVEHGTFLVEGTVRGKLPDHVLINNVQLLAAIADSRAAERTGMDRESSPAEFSTVV